MCSRRVCGCRHGRSRSFAFSGLEAEHAVCPHSRPGTGRITSQISYLTLARREGRSAVGFSVGFSAGFSAGFSVGSSACSRARLRRAAPD